MKLTRNMLLLAGLAIGGLAAATVTPALAQQNARAAYERAQQLRKAGKYSEAIRYAERAEKLAKNKFGANHKNYAFAIDLLARLYHRQGRYAEAEPLHKRSLAIREMWEKLLGGMLRHVATSLNNLAALYRDQGRYAEAEPLYKRSLAIKEKVLGRADPSVATGLNNLAELYRAQGRYAEAEPLYKRSLEIREKALGGVHTDVAQSLNNLALLYKTQGRYAEAEPLYKRSLEINEKALGSAHPYVGTGLNNLAGLYRDQGRYTEAEPLYKRSIAIKEKALGRAHPSVGNSLNNLALLYTAQGRYGEAEPLYKRSLTIREMSLGRTHPRVAQSLNNLALLYQAQGRYGEAESLYKRSLPIREKALGRAHPDVAQTLYNLGLLDRELGRWDDAYDHFERAASIQETLTLRGLKQRKTSGGRPQANRAVFRNLIEAAWELGEQRPERQGVTTGAAFRAAQWTWSTSAGAALAQMAARFGSGNGELARMIRTRQDLAVKWQKLDKQLIKAIGASGAKRSETKITKLRAALAETEKRIATLNARLEKAFPEFAEISNPKPLSFQQTQAVIKPDEALLLYVVGKKATYVWALSRDGGHWGQVALSAKALAQKVAALRRGLDPSSEAGSDGRGLSRTGGEGPPFNLDVAHQLYKELLAPFEDVFKDKKKLLIVPSGALTSLPFHVLTTEKPAVALPDYAGYRRAAWLARRHAITVLPTVSSLRALRVFAKKQRAKRQFIGFGDPIFRGAGTGADKRQPAQFASIRKRGFRTFFRGDHADLEVLSRSLPRLPDTADELKAIARTLGVPKSEIRLREKATETAVKRAPLNRYRVVHFATHGLVAGQTKAVGGRAEPALALSLPRKATASDDGLLTASEVAQLKLNADWVILSACNTAAGDKPGAEALSGLARAFFYSGARSLLVSHWPVASDAAVKLTTGAFAQIKANPTMGRAEALRRSMLALMADTSRPANAHPAYWAPFVIVGEGAG